MGLVSSSIPNLLNGVSQQPAPLRQPTQAEIQENGLSDVSDGLKKRPHTSFKGVLQTQIPYADGIENALSYYFQWRGSTYLYWHTYTASYDICHINVYSIGGKDELPVIESMSFTGSSLTSSGGYLYTPNPKRDIKVLVTDAGLLLLNRAVTVSQSTTTTSGTLNSQLYNSFSDLPDGVGDSAVVGNTYKIIGAATSAFDNYYVKALSTNTYEETLRPGQQYRLLTSTMPYLLAPNSSGGWNIGTINWGTRTCGDSDSAPFPSFVGNTIEQLFYFKNRLGILSADNVIFSESGDPYDFFPKTVTTILDDAPIDVSLKDTAGNTLNHAVVFNDTLTLFSKSRQFKVETNGPLTQQTISVVPTTDFDCDTTIPPVGAQNVLYFAAPRSGYTSIKEYFIEADTIRSDAIELTAHVPKYIPSDIKTLVPFESNDLILALTYSGRVFVYKYFTDGEKKLQASWSEWIFPSVKRILDIYAFDDLLHYSAEQLERDASDNVNGVDYSPTDADLILGYIDFSQATGGVQATDTTGNTKNFTALLDNKWIPQDIQSGHGQTPIQGNAIYYFPTPDITYVMIPEALRSPENAASTVVIDKTTGKVLDFEYQLDPNGVFDPYSSILIPGQYTYGQLIIGFKYDFKYRLSPQYIRENNGAQAVQSGRLQLRSMRVGFEDTGYFKVEVTPQNRATSTYEYTGQVINQIGSTIGMPSLSDGTFKFPVLSKNDSVIVEIKSDSFIPCAFQTIEWEGFYTIRSQRI